MTSCAAIGEGNLLLSCLRDLLEERIDVRAVFTNTECIAEFCQEEQIPHYKRNVEFHRVLECNSMDYLFSITNPRILKAEDLTLPKKLAINYHDSPLPAYAGVHATSWAIMRGERQHGISWHVVETGIDTGDIIQSEAVEISDDDSALTVNLKCHEAARLAFKRLLSEIVQKEHVTRRRQIEVGRSYFGLYAIPENIGVLPFRKDAQSIYNLARALEFGHHENALGSPKIITEKGDFFLVTNVAKTTNTDTITASGQIIDVFDDTLVVSTATSPLLVSIANLDGSAVPENQFRALELRPGNLLKADFTVDIDSIASVRRTEGFWRRKMAKYEPTVFYRQRMNVVAGIIDVSTHVNMKSVELPLPDVNPEAEEKITFLQACFVAFLARICCTSNVCVGLLADKSYIPLEAQSLYSDITPGTFHLDVKSEVNHVLSQCLEAIQKYRLSQSFLIDMFYRYPELRGQKRTPHHNLVIGSKGKDVCESDFADKILHDCTLLLLFTETGNEMHFIYNERPAQDFSHIVDVLKHFPTFLTAISNCEEEMKLNAISMVPKEEMDLYYPMETYKKSNKKGLFKLFAEQSTRRQHHLAVKTTHGNYTYTDALNEVTQMFNALTEHIPLQKGKRTIFGLHMPNSAAYVFSILAVIKTGSAFLPLPVDCPSERLGFSLRDANVKLLLTTKKILEKVELNGLSMYMKIVMNFEMAGETLVLIEFVNRDGDMSERQNGIENTKHDKEDHRTTADFSYIMYTSGSTGRPKGVQVKESSIINLARAQIKEWSLSPEDTIAQFASIGFDASISEIFTALLSGATLAVLNLNERLGNEFICAMNKMKVTVITLAPSALNIYSPSKLPSLKKVVTAGEACTLNTAIKWTTDNDIRFFNAYGPTEGTVCATSYEHVRGTYYEDVNRELPIGKAIDGALVYLFDEFMNPIPPDVVGEIFIGGKGLAHGYIGHAAHLNSHKFVQNPLVKENMLLYKTGDHAYQDVDGNITYVGRMDDQVKIRGQRVDLNEIEQVLIQHPKIEMAVVVVHRCSMSKDLSIAAYIAPSFVYISELREYLSKVLPKYMIPTYIKKLEVADLPQTLNGKVNRKKLQIDESVHEQHSKDGHSHLNETQLLVGKHWCTVLKLDESFVYSLHRQSSFSELGGNSLQLVLLLRLLEDDLQTDYAFTDLGTADTIEEFAEVIKRKRDMLRQSEHGNMKTNEGLRHLILQDSELDPKLLCNVEKRRSVQFGHFASIVNRSVQQQPKNVLISGVTGFLGAFLLYELLEQTEAHICCMVRETTEARGLGRIIDNMRKYGLWKFEYVSRIAVVISDLSQKRMGIAPDIYDALCNAIDVVFMNAAQMNFNAPYGHHRIPNVEGTKEFIDFAFKGIQKYFFSTSSLSVFLFPPTMDGNSRRICSESEFFEDPLMIEGGYGQSKWASERLINQALDHLPGGAIFRPARISGRSINGVGPKNDLFASTLIGVKRLGSYPDMNFPYDLTPVDYCAKAMVEIALNICNQSGPKERVYHLFNRDTVPFNELFEGMNLRPLSLSEWRNELRNADAENKELIPLTPFFNSAFWDRAPLWPIFETTNTDSATSESTKQLMKPTRELLKIYKSFFGV